MRFNTIATFAALLSVGPGNAADLARTILPIQKPLLETNKTLDFRKATAPPRFNITAPAGTPNVWPVLINELATPVVEAKAEEDAAKKEMTAQKAISE